VLALVIAALAGLTISGIIGAKKSGTATLIFGILAIVICIANMSDLSGVIDKEKAQSGGLVSTGAGTSFGAGLLILLVADLLVIVAAILTMRANRPRIRT
jgi:hypothetical protein